MGCGIIHSMPTWDEVKAAEQSMNAAHKALRAYLERPASKPQDMKLHIQLADKMYCALDEYLRLLIEFEKQQASQVKTT